MPLMSCSSMNTKSNFTVHVIITTITKTPTTVMDFFYIDNGIFSPGCWFPRGNRNTVNGMIPGGSPVGWEDRPKVFYFGNTTDQNVCKQWCSEEPLCYAYSLSPLQATPPFQCYGRGYRAREINPFHNNYKSGVKLC